MKRVTKTKHRVLEQVQRFVNRLLLKGQIMIVLKQRSKGKCNNVEENSFEVRLSSLLYVSVRIFGLDSVQNTLNQTTEA